MKWSAVLHCFASRQQQKWHARPGIAILYRFDNGQLNVYGKLPKRDTLYATSPAHYPIPEAQPLLWSATRDDKETSLAIKLLLRGPWELLLGPRHRFP